jgi:hypothetical protein
VRAEEGVEHRRSLAAGDHDLAPPVVAWPAATLDEVGHRLLQVVAAGERQPAVALRGADRRPRGLDHAGWWLEVGVEVLHPQDVRIGAGGRGHAVDVEPRDLVEARDAHAGSSHVSPR